MRRKVFKTLNWRILNGVGNEITRLFSYPPDTLCLWIRDRGILRISDHSTSRKEIRILWKIMEKLPYSDPLLSLQVARQLRNKTK